MKLIYALVVIAALASSAQAVPERITTGPYTVSFDMNTTMNYTVEILPAREMGNETYAIYQIVASTDNSSWATIVIDDYRDLQDSNIKDELRYRNLLIGKENGTFAGERKIDGKKGVFNNITRSNGDQFSDAFYWLDSNKCECGPVYVGRVSVEVLSTYPRDTVENLLRTINVTSSEVPAAIQPQAQAATEPASASSPLEESAQVPTQMPVQTSTQTPVPTPAQAPVETSASIVPNIIVANQNPAPGNVVIQEVDSSGPGFAVIHADLNGAPGEILGYTPVRNGVNRNVVVSINTARATNPLFAVLHQDGGSIDTYEEGIDLPFRYQGEIVAKLFSIWPASTIPREIEGIPPNTLDFLSDNWVSGYENPTYTMY
ncbi:MAG TPA: hypothetical protein VN455_13230 [Methanotrichaceae archaeon]|nr:hypothetical protein [Methanotrichaceae archaeon]